MRNIYFLRFSFQIAPAFLTQLPFLYLEKEVWFIDISFDIGLILI